MTQDSDFPALKILLAAPRGFCAGVDRAIQIVEVALKKFGAPVYVRHEIVHNKFVVQGLKDKGAVFVEELDEVPEGAPVVFSAHGVPKSVIAEAEKRNMIGIDAACPLVSKVHHEAEFHHRSGRQVILVGHTGHPEVIGTMGQLPEGEVLLIETEEEVATLQVRDENQLAFCTQTTLSVDDTEKVVAALKARFPAIQGPGKEDICYATTNRQSAVKTMAPQVEVMLVVGAPNSSNSKRLAEVAKIYGCPKSALIQRASEIDWDWVGQPKALGITAGASAPEVLVDEVVAALKQRFNITIEEVRVADEHVVFNLPKALVA